MIGDDGFLTLTVKMRVSPEQNRELLDLMKRYRSALNYSIIAVLNNKALTLSKAHKLLYRALREKFSLPSGIAASCYKEAISIAKSWISNPRKGKIPTAKSFRIWLRSGEYRIRDGFVEFFGIKLKIVGWDRRYDEYPNREARIVLKNNKFMLYIYKRIPKPSKYIPKGVLAVDINEKHIVVGNSRFEIRFKTAVKRAVHYKKLAEMLQKKYSFTRYMAWFRRSGINKRIRSFNKKVSSIIDDWVKKIAHEIVKLAKENQYAIVREDLTNLVEYLRNLQKDHKVALLILSYRKIGFWIDWQAEKNGVPVVAVEPKGTSRTCPKCNSRMVRKKGRIFGCSNCGFEADRDRVAIMNLEKLYRWEEPTPSTDLQVTDVKPNRWGKLVGKVEGYVMNRRGWFKHV